jgi:hypothetical protein
MFCRFGNKNNYKPPFPTTGMNKKRLIGLSLVFLGMVLTLGDVRFTGAVIGGGFFSWLGMVGLLSFLIGGVMIAISNPYLRENQYYTRRTKEIFNPIYDHQDVWIARGELKGIMDELKNNPRYNKPVFEHGNDAPTIHLSGRVGVPKNIEHLDVKIKDMARHLLITEDPYDSRINTIGIKSSPYNPKRGERARSKVYQSNYPRSKDIGKKFVETVSPSERKRAA